MNHSPKDQNDWQKRIPVRTNKAAGFGYGMIALFLGSFTYWASTAPIAGATIAPGVVAAAGQNVEIKHPEGGIVATIQAREGDRIKAGDTLFVLKSETVTSQLNLLQKQKFGFQALISRLIAERDSLPEIMFGPDLKKSAIALDLQTLIDEQKREFDIRNKRYASEIRILNQRVLALEEALIGAEAQKQSLDEQIIVVREEAERKRQLLEKGLTNRSEYTDLLLSETQLVGQIGTIIAQISQSRVGIVEAQEQLVRQETQRVEDAIARIYDIRLRINDLEEQINVAQTALEQITVTAPTDGIIIRSSVNAEGGVIRAGDVLLEILPTAQDLIVEARIRPIDVDAVKLGQRASLRFSTLKESSTPEIDGTVSYKSADRIIDPTNQQPYFTVRLKIDGELPADFSLDRIFPGMPVETMIATEERTFWEYISKPVRDSFTRAFSEG